jgi:hypothetical protein
MHILSHIHLEYDLLLHISIPHRYKSVYDELKNVTCQEVRNVEALSSDVVCHFVYNRNAKGDDSLFASCGGHHGGKRERDT